MKLAVALLLLGTTFGAGSAVLAAGQASTPMHDAAVASPATRTGPDSVRTQIDDDRQEGRHNWLWMLSSDDDDEDHDDCEEEDDDDGCTTGNTGNPAGSGAVAPPNNGLFTNGTAPVVKSN